MMPPESVATLYDSHALALYRFLLSLTGSEADARDLLQDLFARLIKDPSRALNDPQAYLFRAARNGFTDLVRRSAHRRQVLSCYAGEMDIMAACESDSPAAPDPTLAVAKALACLPDEQRAVVHLKIWENLTFTRIAEILGIPAGTAASRYRYAMEHLRQIIPNPTSSHAP